MMRKERRDFVVAGEGKKKILARFFLGRRGRSKYTPGTNLHSRRNVFCSLPFPTGSYHLYPGAPPSVPQTKVFFILLSLSLSLDQGRKMGGKSLFRCYKRLDCVSFHFPWPLNDRKDEEKEKKGKKNIKKTGRII